MEIEFYTTGRVDVQIFGGSDNGLLILNVVFYIYYTSM